MDPLEVEEEGAGDDEGQEGDGVAAQVDDEGVVGLVRLVDGHAPRVVGLGEPGPVLLAQPPRVLWLIKRRRITMTKGRTKFLRHQSC